MYLTMSIFLLFIIALDLFIGAVSKKSAPYVYDSQTMSPVPSKKNL